MKKYDDKKENIILAKIGFYGAFICGIFIFWILQAIVNYQACSEYYPNEVLKCFISSKYRVEPK